MSLPRTSRSLAGNETRSSCNSIAGEQGGKEEIKNNEKKPKSCFEPKLKVQASFPKEESMLHSGIFVLYNVKESLKATR